MVEVVVVKVPIVYDGLKRTPRDCNKMKGWYFGGRINEGLCQFDAGFLVHGLFLPLTGYRILGVLPRETEIRFFFQSATLPV